MRKYLQLSKLNDWLYGLPDEEFGDLTCEVKADSPRGTQDEYDFSYYLSECTDAFFQFLVANGLFVRGGTITYDTDYFGNIATAAAAVMADYDDDHDALAKLGCLPPYTNADGSRTEVMPWVKWELGGDDDVDYNGSYITMALDVLLEYELAHGGEEAKVTSDGTETNRGIGQC